MVGVDGGELVVAEVHGVAVAVEHTHQLVFVSGEELGNLGGKREVGGELQELACEVIVNGGDVSSQVCPVVNAVDQIRTGLRAFARKGYRRVAGDVDGAGEVLSGTFHRSVLFHFGNGACLQGAAADGEVSGGIHAPCAAVVEGGVGCHVAHGNTGGQRHNHAACGLQGRFVGEALQHGIFAGVELPVIGAEAVERCAGGHLSGGETVHALEVLVAVSAVHSSLVVVIGHHAGGGLQNSLVGVHTGHHTVGDGFGTAYVAVVHGVEDVVLAAALRGAVGIEIGHDAAHGVSFLGTYGAHVEHVAHICAGHVGGDAAHCIVHTAEVGNLLHGDVAGVGAVVDGAVVAACDAAGVVIA
ncbi:unknown [Prevotella sp. CAG:485]|nr:unknown [Prevotella sp. CAG:485]